MSVEIEERLAHLEKLVDELDGVAADGALKIARLEQQVAKLMEREAAREADGQGAVIFGDERPPHY